jgi:fibrillarin-like pre-rRNA processing protein
MEQLFPGVWKKGKDVFTKNLVPGVSFYGEQLLKIKGTEYRHWDPYRSKPAAAILRGLKNFPIKKDAKILYLGIANGSTASFLSDIIGVRGFIYGVEISSRPFRDLIPTAEKRKNIFPILANAREPEKYGWVEKADLVYQDVATRDQSDILIRNCRVFLKEKGFAVIAIKARSIDVVEKPENIYKEEIKKLSKHFEILEKVELGPFEKDHLFVIMRLKS